MKATMKLRTIEALAEVVRFNTSCVLRDLRAFVVAFSKKKGIGPNADPCSLIPDP